MPLEMKQALKSAAVYFAIVFAAGFVLGVLRTLVLERALGPIAAVALELPVILGIAWVACGWILRRWPLEGARAALMGAGALALLLLAEAALSVLLAGRSLGEHLALYTQAAHQLGLAGQLVFAAWPVVRSAAAQRQPLR
jgi:hypothetical protein